MWSRSRRAFLNTEYTPAYRFNPLVERDPVLTWKIIAGVLALSKL